MINLFFDPVTPLSFRPERVEKPAVPLSTAQFAVSPWILVKSFSFHKDS